MIETPLARRLVFQPDEWAGLLMRIPAPPRYERIERAIHGAHLRAGRALLDWPMLTLATASGLSLSTVKRLEGTEGGPLTQSHLKAIEALRQAGIEFVLLTDGTVAVAKPASTAMRDEGGPAPTR